MGIHWEYLDASEQASWYDIASEDNIYDFEQAILRLEESNRNLKNPGTIFREGGLGKLLGGMDQSSAGREVRKHLKKIDDYADSLMKKSKYRMSTGGKDHMSWRHFPNIDRINSLQNRAHKALTRSGK